ncbi:hypothetical protein [Roseobacter sp.]|uniref:hypothetical protein n=1 Tax=Roseobacter sp. TaxID=1907202 RepID=UPI003296BC6B
MNNEVLNLARTAMAELNKAALKPSLLLAIRRIAILALASCGMTMAAWTAFWISKGLDAHNLIQASFSILTLTGIVVALVAALCMGFAGQALKGLNR